MIPHTQVVMDIFCEAIEKYSPDQWNDFVKRVCAGNTELKDRVTELLTAHTISDSLIDRPTLDDIPSIGEQIGDRIGPYQILSQIGAGAFGIVYLVEQSHPLRRVLAMKILKLGSDTRQIIRRFESERETLAKLDHPHISRIIDAGATNLGRLYFVMDHVDGLSLTDHCRKFQLKIPDRLNLFLDLCGAVQHAHQRGVIHRDLKPSNIMVANVDGTPWVKVIDFGVSKAISLEDGPTTLGSVMPHLLGTPNYMSPEQFSLGQSDVDSRSDVYSLGMILYELLVGGPVYNDRDLRRHNLIELARVVCDEVPPLPSRHVQSRASFEGDIQRKKEFGLTAKELCTELESELDWIVMKAIDKAPTRRYSSAESLAADVQCYMQGQMVTARPPSVWYVAKKFVERNRVWVASFSLISTIFMLAVFAITWENDRTNAALNNIERVKAEKRLRERDLLVRQYPTDIKRAWSLSRLGQRETARNLLDRYDTAESDFDPRDFAWRYLHQRLSADTQHFTGILGAILSSDISPDEQWIVGSDRLGSVCIWNVAIGKLVRNLRYSDKEVTCVSFSPDGQLLATVGLDRYCHLWDMETWKEKLQIGPHAATITSVDWSPDGKRLVTGGRDKTVRIWDAETGSSLKAFRELEDVVRSVNWSKNGKLLAAAEGPTVHIWQTEDWTTLRQFRDQEYSLHCVSFSPDSRRLLAVGHDRKLHFYDMARMESLETVDGNGHFWSADWSPLGDYVAVGSGVGGPRIWKQDSASYHEILNALEIQGNERVVKFTSDGNKILSANEDQREIVLWDHPRLLGYRELELAGNFLAAKTTANLAVVVSGTHQAALHSLTKSQSPWQLNAGVNCAAIAAEGELLATSLGNELYVWHIPSRSLKWKQTINLDNICRVVFSHSGRMVAVSTSVNDWFSIDSNDGKTIGKGTSRGNVVPAFEFSPDDRFLSAITREGVETWSTSDGSLVRSYPHDIGSFRCLVFNPRGDRIYLSSRSEIVILDLASGKFDPQVFHSLSKTISSMTVSPDGRTLATATEAGSLHLFDTVTGSELLTLGEHYQHIWGLQFETNERLRFGTILADGRPALVLFDVGNGSR